MRQVWLRTFVSLGFIGSLLAWRMAHSGPENVVKVQKTLMGTLWTIEVGDRGKPGKALQDIQAAYAELERIDQLMSEWRPNSPISQVNAAAGTGVVEVPAELRELIQRSVDYSRKSEGTFDITWRGMGRIWRFDDQFRVPSAVEVEAARKRVDFTRIQIEGNRVGLPAGMNIGLGGIAKGYAVDRAMAVLEGRGVRDALVNGGGDVLVRGSRNGKPWRLGIQHPRAEHGTLLGSLPLSSGALVTSGDYERFRMMDGVRYHHIIDPRTGWPAKGAMSVTVISPGAEIGVVLAKVLFILGPDKGLPLVRAQGVEALLIDEGGKEHRTAGFPSLEPAE